MCQILRLAVSMLLLKLHYIAFIEMTLQIMLFGNYGSIIVCFTHQLFKKI